MSEPTIDGAYVIGFDPIIIRGERGDPGVLVLDLVEDVPVGTPAGTIIFRRTS